MSSTYPFELIRTKKSSLSIRIDAKGKLIVKAPFFVPQFLINKFVEDRYDWIEKNLKKIKPLSMKDPDKIGEGDEFLYMGNIYKFHIGNYKEITFSDKLYFPEFLMFRARKEITQWYINKARKVITGRVKYYSALMKKNYKSISYSDTISKWGSCKGDNSLQFNWRLIMSPILVIDYVVVHELAHTTEKNHGKKFWKIVEEYKPAYKQYIKWLKDNSHRLHSI